MKTTPERGERRERGTRSQNESDEESREEEERVKEEEGKNGYTRYEYKRRTQLQLHQTFLHLSHRALFEAKKETEREKERELLRRCFPRVCLLHFVSLNFFRSLLRLVD